MMIKKILYYFILIVSIYSCRLQKPDIEYNPRKKYFEYQGSVLRLPDMSIVDSTNVDVYRSELSKKPKPVHSLFFENEASILQSDDYRIAELYSEIQTLIKNKDYSKALIDIRLLRYIYPEIIYFSDIYFLEAQAQEAMGNKDTSIALCKSFLQYSSQKYSGRFYGYIYADKNDTNYILQRNFAMATVHGFSIPLSLTDSLPIEPTYFYESFQPGFLENPDDYKNSSSEKKFLYVAQDIFKEIGVGAVLYYNFKNTLIFVIKSQVTRATSQLEISFPIQMYKSKHSRLGIKCTPFAVNNITSEDYFPELSYRSIPNFGATLSMGYYVFPNIALGSYYRYNYFNARHVFILTKTDYSFYRENIYDISVYYNVIKNLSFKAGVNNNYPSIGIFRSGYEISYRFIKNDLNFRIVF